MYKTRTTDLDELKNSIRSELSNYDHAVIQPLCISGIVSQHASRPAAVISSTVFDFHIVFAAITAIVKPAEESKSCTPIGRFGLILQLSVMTLCFAIRSDCLIRVDDKQFVLNCSDFHTGMSQPEEKRLVPTSTGHAMRLDRKPGHDYDNVIDTVRITAVKENLRPTIMSSKQQSVSKGKSVAYL